MNHHLGRLLPVLGTVLVLFVVATASASAATLTKAQYTAMLTKANARVTKVESAAERGLTPKATRAQAKSLLLAWANTETQLGKSFRSVQAPANIRAANSLLARGEITFGSELRSAATHLPLKKAAIGSFLQQRLSGAHGAAMIDRALKKLKAAGYTIR